MRNLLRKTSDTLATLIGISNTGKKSPRDPMYLANVLQVRTDFVIALRSMWRNLKRDVPLMPTMPRWNQALFNPGQFEDRAYYSVERSEFHLFFSAGNSQYVVVGSNKHSVDLADFKLFMVTYDEPSMGYVRVHFKKQAPTKIVVDAIYNTYGSYMVA